MDAEAFISHTFVGGLTTAERVKLKLKVPPLDMESFVSSDNIVPGDIIIEEILKHITNCEILFVVVNSAVQSSGWVIWEREFCQRRNIRTIDVVHHQMLRKKEQIPFVISEKYIENHLDDNLEEYVYHAIDDVKQSLEGLAQTRLSITISAEPEKDCYKESETVKITGKVENSKDGRAFLHIPVLSPEETLPIVSEEIIKSIAVDKDGIFEINFPVKNSSMQDKIWYVELRFGCRSKIIPIKLCNEEVTGRLTAEDIEYDDVSEIKEKLEIISKGTYSSIPKELDEKSIPRKEVKQIISALEAKKRLIITGERGIGKSVILCQLFNEIKDNRPVLFLRSDDILDEKTNPLSSLKIDLFSKDVFQKIKNKNKNFVVIIDSIDAISRNQKLMNLVRRFLIFLWGMDISTICSVRKYDYQYSPTIKAIDWGKEFEIKGFNEIQIKSILEKFSNVTIPADLEPILVNPFNLSLVLYLIKESQIYDFGHIRNEISLFNEHWNELVEKSEYAHVIKNALFKTVSEMMNKQRIQIQYEDINEEQGLDLAFSKNILERNDLNQIRFFHHVYLDFVFSKMLFVQDVKIENFLLENNYNLFVRPTLQFLFEMIKFDSHHKYVESITKILESKLRFYWKISALHSIAKINEISEKELEGLGKILNNTALLQRHFLREITKIKNSFWFKIWGSSLLKEWSIKPEYGNGHFLVQYLDSISDKGSRHSLIFELLQNIVSKFENTWLKKTAIETSVKLTSVDRSSWYSELSNHENSNVRWGILSCLPEFIKTNPANTSEVFYNIFTYDETSQDPTIITQQIPLTLTSTKSQDNRHIIWQCGEMFPKLLELNPEFMIKSTIKIIEKNYWEYLEAPGDIVEDGSYVWYGEGEFSGLHDENGILSHVKAYLLQCEEKQLREIIPVINSTKSAIFHSFLLDAFNQNPEKFRNEIFEEISEKESFKIETLRLQVRNSIQKSFKYFTKVQQTSLIDKIMSTKYTKKGIEKYEKKYKAEYLNQIPQEYLTKEQIDLINEIPKERLEYRPSFSITSTIEEQPVKKMEEIPKEKIIESLIDKDLNYRQKIQLLETIADFLIEKKELNSEKVKKIKNFLISHVDHSDPEAGIEEKGSNIMFVHPSIRGLTASGLMRLYYQNNDEELISHIVKLSNDSTNIVRGEIAKDLRYIAIPNYSLSKEIIVKYSLDPDPRVQFFMSPIVQHVATYHQEDAPQIIENLLTTTVKENYEVIRNVESILVHLAIKFKNTHCRKLLDDIINEKLFSPEIKRNIAFLLKETYLFDEEYQDESLNIILKLLDDPDAKVREGAVFFLLYPLEKENKINNIQKTIEKIQPHLEKISTEVDREKPDGRILHHLITFLEKYWSFMPQKTVEYISKITKISDANYESMLVRSMIRILNGLFQDNRLSQKEIQTCFDILDLFSEVGWDEALLLLDTLERND